MAREFHRPARLSQQAMDDLPGGVDPAVKSQAAHESAQALLARLHADSDPAQVERMVRVVDTEGLDVVAALWSDSPPVTLPGALWRLYLVRDVVRRSPDVVAARYRAGVVHEPVQDAVAGVPTALSAGPNEVAATIDEVLSGAFAGDLDVALNRAAAMCRIIATGAAHDADRAADDRYDEQHRVIQGAAALVTTADELESAARAWRAGHLD